MAFSIRKREERKTGIGQGMLEAAAMQKLQNRFCEANQVYLICLSKGQGYLTKAYGSKEELEFLHGSLDMGRNVDLLNKLSGSDSENVIEETCVKDYMKVCGVAIRINKEVEAIWIMAGVLDWYSVEAPDCVMRTTTDRYYKSLDLLVTITEQMFSVNREELMAQEAFLRGRETALKMEAAMHRNEIMSGMIKMLGSQEDAADISASILKETCEYLDVSLGSILVERSDGEAVEVFCRYARPEAEKGGDARCRFTKKEAPFFNGKTYVISSDSLMPDEFCGLFGQNGWTAALFLPMDVRGCKRMYLCFMEQKKQRVWNAKEIQFVSAVKCILQSILQKES